MTLDHFDNEKLALVLLTRTIEDDRCSLSPRIHTHSGRLAKLDPPSVVTTKPSPATRPNDRPRVAIAARKRRNK